MLSSNGNAILQLDQNDGSQKEDEENGISLIEKRNALNVGFILGAGIKLKGAATGKGFFTLEARYNLGLTDIINGDTRNDANITVNSTLRNTYGYIDDAYTINQLTFSIGYLIPIYRPKILATKYKKTK